MSAGGLRAIFEGRSARELDATALSEPGRQPTKYRELIAQVDAVASFLQAHEVSATDRVAVVLPNGSDMASAFLGVATAACCAPLNPAYREPEFDFYMRDLNVRALIVPAGSDSPSVTLARSMGAMVVELRPLAGAGQFELSASGATPSAQASDSSSERAAPPTSLILHTSGTTSRPKMVPLSPGNLSASARNIRGTLGLTAADVALNVMPLFHIHGLIGVLLSSMSAGGSVVCSPGFEAHRFLQWLEEFSPTWYSAVPTIHQAVLSAATHQERPLKHSLRFIRSSSASLPARLMADMEAKFGVPLIEAYGMTEASHQMTSNPLPPRARKASSVGIPHGLEVAVLDDAGKPVAPETHGQVVIRGPNVTAGYAGGAEQNATAFIDGWFKTGDQGYFDRDGYLFLTGRLKEIINRAGEKISPREVDEVLLGHAAVATAVTFAMPDAIFGEEVAAAIVLREGMTATESELRAFAAQTLSDFKVPKRVVFVREIPKGPTGKLQRIGLAAVLGLDGKRKESPAAHAQPAPEDAVQRVVASACREVLGIEKMGIHDNFFDLGGQSVALVRVAQKIKQELGVEVSPQLLFDSPTIADMSAAVREVVAEGGGEKT